MRLPLILVASAASFSTSVSAEDLGRLKSDLAAMESRMARLETSAPPAGASVITVTKSDMPAWVHKQGRASERGGWGAYAINVVPAADADPGLIIKWSGHVRAMLEYLSDEEDAGDADAGIGPDNSDAVHINSRVRLSLVAETDTAVGKIGVETEFGANAQGFDIPGDDVNFKSYTGRWQFDDQWVFSGGFTDASGTYVAHGQEENASLGNTINLAGEHGSAAEFLKLGWTSGDEVWTWQGTIEDYEPTDEGAVIDSDLPAVTSSLGFASGMWSAQLVAGVGEDEAADGGGALDWVVAGGATYAKEGAYLLSISASAGEGWGDGTDTGFWKASVYAGFNLTEAARAEASAGYSAPEGGGNDSLVVNAGLYWEPVDQLTIGVQGDYADPQGADAVYAARFVSRWDFVAPE